jgi:hypothetical protein
MAETLLSPSNVLLFGRVVADLNIVAPDDTISPGLKPDTRVKVVDTGNVADLTHAPTNIDGVDLKKNNRVLLTNQGVSNGVYIFTPAAGATGPTLELSDDDDYAVGMIVQVRRGTGDNVGSFWKVTTTNPLTFVRLTATSNLGHNPFEGPRFGNQLLQSQLDGASFARIYGFSFEGTYFDLTRPTLFLVHGPGTPATESRPGWGRSNPSRAPSNPSLSGLGAADFEFSDDMLVWSYDKADYTIRMDVETGMFEDVLLDAMLGGGSDGMDARGMNARGMNARGMNARGMNARGMNARGMNARGGGSD